MRLRRKDAARQRARSGGRDFTRYHLVIDEVERPHQNKRNAIRSMVEELAARGTPLAEIRKLMPERVMRSWPAASSTPTPLPRPYPQPTPRPTWAAGTY